MVTILKFAVICICCIFFNIQAKQIVQLGVEDVNFYPIYGTYDAEDNKLLGYDGYSADVFKLFNKSQDYFEIKFIPVQIQRLYVEYLAENSILDAKYPDDPIWRQDLKQKVNVKIHYSYPIFKYTDGTFVLKEKQNIKIENIKTLGMIRGFTPVGYEERIKSGKIKLEETINVKDLFTMLIEKKVDGVFISKYVGLCKLKSLKLQSKIVFNNNLPILTGDYRLSSKKNIELIKRFNHFLQKNKWYISNMEKNILKYKCN